MIRTVRTGLMMAYLMMTVCVVSFVVVVVTYTCVNTIVVMVIGRRFAVL